MSGEADPKSRSDVALTVFKDWSNYLLVTTVAAAGWVSSGAVSLGEVWQSLALMSFGVSIVFGIFTLALIPLLAQELGKQELGKPDTQTSIYDVPIRYHLFSREKETYLTQACRPQHITFIAGVAFYCIGAVDEAWWALVPVVAASALYVLSAPREALANRFSKLGALANSRRS